MEILEHIAAIDASVAWNVMLGSEINAMAVGGMDPELARKSTWVTHALLCAVAVVQAAHPRAERQPDGSVKVWGQTAFISGCHNADFCLWAHP
ncbi:MAG: hypothetical protein ACNYPE_06860 [Candidatus Azotimanducaceae bacterium WSBS_2022_MAG_OTU7]